MNFANIIAGLVTPIIDSCDANHIQPTFVHFPYRDLFTKNVGPILVLFCHGLSHTMKILNIQWKVIYVYVGWTVELVKSTVKEVGQLTV